MKDRSEGLSSSVAMRAQHSLLSMELDELQVYTANYKSQMEQKCEIYEVEAAHKATMCVLRLRAPFAVLLSNTPLDIGKNLNAIRWQ